MPTAQAEQLGRVGPMPRRSTKKSVAAPVVPITAADAVALWREAGGKGLADASTATTMAEALNALIGHRSWETERGRRYAKHSEAFRCAARTLELIEAEIIAAANAPGATADLLAALPPLPLLLAEQSRENLSRLLAIVAPAPASRPPWADAAAAAWQVAVAAGAPASTARTATATRFAASAVVRLGFDGQMRATPAAISRMLRRSKIPRE